jgi:hypothetical protein
VPCHIAQAEARLRPLSWAFAESAAAASTTVMAMVRRMAPPCGVPKKSGKLT